MITIRVWKMNAIYFMYITGYNSLFKYDDTITNNTYDFGLKEINIILNYQSRFFYLVLPELSRVVGRNLY